MKTVAKQAGFGTPFHTPKRGSASMHCIFCYHKLHQSFMLRIIFIIRVGALVCMLISSCLCLCCFCEYVRLCVAVLDLVSHVYTPLIEIWACSAWSVIFI